MKNNIHKYKVVKVVELIVFFLTEVIFLCVLIGNKTMRTSIFFDKSLFILCSIMYFTILFSLGMLVYDFLKLRNLKTEAHELENLAFLDRKTGIPNRTSVNILSDSYKTPTAMKGLACVISEISNIKEINEANGKFAGDQAITEFSATLEKSAEGYGFVGRNGGNEYVTVLEKCDEKRVEEFLSKLSKNIEISNEANPNRAVKVHSEYVLFDKEGLSSFSELLAKAYSKLGR